MSQHSWSLHRVRGSWLAAATLGLGASLPGQGTWQQLAPGSTVSEMILPGMVYDASRDRVVRYGGYSCTEPLGRTWEWDGTSWQRVFPAVSPPPRDATAMVYDSHRKRTIMFGGSYGALDRNDLWEWDGTTWTERLPAVRPTARTGHMMAYDERRRCVVLFGGNTASNVYFNDTWTWDGTQWQQQTPVSRPLPRAVGSMAYDPERGRVVMFGGIVGTPFRPFTDETWEWDGTNWMQAQPAVRPLPRIGPVLTYDHQRDQTIAFGGEPQDSSPFFSDTWGWDGQHWTLLVPSWPPGRAGAGLVYDSKRGRLLMHAGGFGTQFFSYCFNDTWALDSAPTGVVGFGAGCPGPLGVPVLSLASAAPAGVGGTLTLRLSGLTPQPAPLAFFVLGGSRQQWNSLSLPWSLGLLQLPSCSLWVSPDIIVPVPVQGGVADLTVPIAFPVQFHVQGLVVDPAAPGTSGWSLSSAASVDAKP